MDDAAQQAKRRGSKSSILERLRDVLGEVWKLFERLSFWVGVIAVMFAVAAVWYCQRSCDSYPTSLALPYPRHDLHQARTNVGMLQEEVRALDRKLFTCVAQLEQSTQDLGTVLNEMIAIRSRNGQETRHSLYSIATLPVGQTLERPAALVGHLQRLHRTELEAAAFFRSVQQQSSVIAQLLFNCQRESEKRQKELSSEIARAPSQKALDLATAEDKAINIEKDKLALLNSSAMDVLDFANQHMIRLESFVGALDTVDRKAAAPSLDTPHDLKEAVYQTFLGAGYDALDRDRFERWFRDLEREGRCMCRFCWPNLMKDSKREQPLD